MKCNYRHPRDLKWRLVLGDYFVSRSYWRFGLWFASETVVRERCLPCRSFSPGTYPQLILCTSRNKLYPPFRSGGGQRVGQEESGLMGRWMGECRWWVRQRKGMLRGGVGRKREDRDTHFLKEFLYIRVLSFFSSFFTSYIPCWKFGSPYLGKPTAAARAALPIPNSACGIFVCPNEGMAANAWDL